MKLTALKAFPVFVSYTRLYYYTERTKQEAYVMCTKSRLHFKGRFTDLFNIFKTTQLRHFPAIYVIKNTLHIMSTFKIVYVTFSLMRLY